MPMLYLLEGFLALNLVLSAHSLNLRTQSPNATKSPSYLLSPGQSTYSDDAVVLFPNETSSNYVSSINASRTDTNPPPLELLLVGPQSADGPKYTCNGTTYGRNLNIRSCLDAIEAVKEHDLPQTFGQRGDGTHWDINLPFRFLSCKCKPSIRPNIVLSDKLGTDDGLCALDISIKAGQTFDTIIPTNIKAYAQALFSICVRGTPNEGGAVTNIGENGALAIRMVPYRPNVQCKEPGSGPPTTNCRKILELMPADGIERRFGPTNDPSVSVKLPKRFITPEARCVLYLDTIEGTDVGDWYKIWAAAVAVETMCVEAKNMRGMAYGLGGFNSTHQRCCAH